MFQCLLMQKRKTTTTTNKKKKETKRLNQGSRKHTYIRQRQIRIKLILLKDRPHHDTVANSLFLDHRC
jgi:hypothetical protein